MYLLHGLIFGVVRYYSIARIKYIISVLMLWKLVDLRRLLMNKISYEQPEMTIITFEDEDIIVTSPGGSSEEEGGGF